MQKMTNPETLNTIIKTNQKLRQYKTKDPTRLYITRCRCNKYFTLARAKLTVLNRKRSLTHVKPICSRRVGNRVGNHDAHRRCYPTFCPSVAIAAHITGVVQPICWNRLRGGSTVKTINSSR